MQLADRRFLLALDAQPPRLIQQILRKSGLSQAELARRAGLPRSVLNAYLRGNREPGADALLRIAGAAGVKLESRSAGRRSIPIASADSRSSRSWSGRGAALSTAGRDDAVNRLAKSASSMNAELVEKLLAIHGAEGELAAPCLRRRHRPCLLRRGAARDARPRRQHLRRRDDAAKVLGALPEGVRGRGATSRRRAGWADPALLGRGAGRRLPQQPAAPRGGRERRASGSTCRGADPGPRLRLAGGLQVVLRPDQRTGATSRRLRWRRPRT